MNLFIEMYKENLKRQSEKKNVLSLCEAKLWYTKDDGDHYLNLVHQRIVLAINLKVHVKYVFNRITKAKMEK
ncbi:hypothetical protein JTE90_006464 [Oedothorax gibbosus]|uniref:Uncharacterized protein n=1 Tax=Oedothorax gibbosus TaxID=931172 RepID=A0AAV6UGU9_9ARAC|nr:hypothetical protein JTE90_006464 [Oedothorax gibbosus]